MSAFQHIFRIALAIILMAGLSVAGQAQAEKRVALVIGNSAYEAVTKLENPANDTADLAATLKQLNFEVDHVTDLTFDDMRRALRRFSEKASRSDVAMVFYAGHGIEVDRQNYLIPVDARLKRADDVDFEALPLDLVMGALNGAKKLKLVLLDACRNNPFAASMKPSNGAKRSIGRGLARVEPAVGTLVGFAAKEGTTASDGEGRNSPYTTALIRHLNEPGLEINLLFRKIRDSVLQQTNGQQEPFTYGSLPGEQLYLKPGNALSGGGETATTPSGGGDTGNGKQPSSIQLSEAAQAWAVTKDSKSIAVLEAYISSFDGTPYAAFARARINELSSQTDEAEKERRRQAMLEQAQREREEVERQQQAREREEQAERERIAAIERERQQDLSLGGTWDHNSSAMRVEQSGNSIRILYSRPKSSIRKHGVRGGTVLFHGRISSSGQINGTAYIFRQGCRPAGYTVSGSVRVSSGRARSITLSGASPQRSGCRVVGYTRNSSNSRLMFYRN